MSEQLDAALFDNITWRGSVDLKKSVRERMDKHIEMDQLLKGTVGLPGMDDESGTMKGCAVWCAIGEYDMRQMAFALGWPEWLVRWYENIFENLNAEHGEAFCVAFLEALPAGYDLKGTEQLRRKLQAEQLRRLKKHAPAGGKLFDDMIAWLVRKGGVTCVRTELLTRLENFWAEEPYPAFTGDFMDASYQALTDCLDDASGFTDWHGFCSPARLLDLCAEVSNTSYQSEYVRDWEYMIKILKGEV